MHTGTDKNAVTRPTLVLVNKACLAKPAQPLRCRRSATINPSSYSLLLGLCCQSVPVNQGKSRPGCSESRPGCSDASGSTHGVPGFRNSAAVFALLMIATGSPRPGQPSSPSTETGNAPVQWSRNPVWKSGLEIRGFWVLHDATASPRAPYRSMRHGKRPAS